ncbi:MAG TPA: YhbY family RNA-binding protein [Thiotrichaceae bacterium]|nr:YhbY family RNA-binding protein [Thiotrichaceae bacterium]
MTLSKPQQKKLKGLAQQLQVIVTIGAQGLKETIHNELDSALNHHQLVKVKIHTDTREQRSDMIATLSKKHQAELILSIGHTACFYRRNKDKTSIL